MTSNSRISMVDSTGASINESKHSSSSCCPSIFQLLARCRHKQGTSREGEEEKRRTNVPLVETALVNHSHSMQETTPPPRPSGGRIGGRLYSDSEVMPIGEMSEERRRYLDGHKFEVVHETISEGALMPTTHAPLGVAFQMGPTDSNQASVERLYDKSNPDIERLWTEYYGQLVEEQARNRNSSGHQASIVVDVPSSSNSSVFSVAHSDDDGASLARRSTLLTTSVDDGASSRVSGTTQDSMVKAHSVNVSPTFDLEHSKRNSPHIDSPQECDSPALPLKRSEEREDLNATPSSEVVHQTSMLRSDEMEDLREIEGHQGLS